ncbi:MAG: helix-turn-helix transcriptional regulator [Alphaproteobacteria bacterium]
MTAADDDWTEWLRQGLSRAGRTQRGLALALGVDASAISRLLHGQRRLRAHEIPVAARYLGLAPAPLLPGPAGADNRRAGPRRAQGIPPAGSPAAAVLELLGVAAGSAADIDDDLFLLNDAAPIDRVRRPDGLLARPRAFALRVIGASMAPRYEPGDTIAVDPEQAPAIGDDVVLALADPAAPTPERASRCLLLKRLVRLTPRQVQLAQFNPRRDDILLPRARVAALWTVLPLGTVLGL